MNIEKILYETRKPIWFIAFDEWFKTVNGLFYYDSCNQQHILAALDSQKTIYSIFSAISVTNALKWPRCLSVCPYPNRFP